MASHQDWTPVVFSKPKAPKPASSTSTRKPKKAPSTMTDTGLPAWKIEQIAVSEEDSMKLNKVSSSTRMTIQTRRAELKLKRKDLAMKCNLPESTIAAYENGTAIVIPSELRKIGRALGVTLS